MGMAASQARYLALTARKTNTEYEGQQINQQRTALANQSADAFNQYMALEVPQPPSKTDFTKVQYTYTQDGIQEAIEDMIALQEGTSDYNYLVTHYHMQDVYTGVREIKVNPQVRLGYAETTKTVSRDNIEQTEAGYKINGYDVAQYDPSQQATKDIFDALCEKYPDLGEVALEDVGVYTDNYDKLHFVDMNKVADVTLERVPEYISGKSIVPTYVGNNELTPYVEGDDKVLDLALAQIRKDNPDDPIATATELYNYKVGDRTYFATKNELLACASSHYDPANPSEAQQNTLNTYYASNINQKITSTDKAFVEFDSSGRATSIKYENSSAVYSISTETISDDDAYLDAMNKYNYDKAKYEKAVQDINAKTEVIQQEDRTLELRLRQLDTEQEALQTELEAVKKVIDKNVESTFKTFSS